MRASWTWPSNLDVPVDVVTERMIARGRDDDTEEGIRRRLELYEEQTGPAARPGSATRSLLVDVDGVGTEDEVFERLVEGRRTTASEA